MQLTAVKRVNLFFMTFIAASIFYFEQTDDAP